jgi:hypothetical protein
MLMFMFVFHRLGGFDHDYEHEQEHEFGLYQTREILRQR